MKQLLKLIPLLLIGFYLITPTNVAAITGPEPNLYLKCGTSDPVAYHVWLPQGAASSPTLNAALGDCEPFLPAKAEIQSLIFTQTSVRRTIVLDNSADAEAFVTDYWPETSCGKLTFHPLEEILIAQTVIPDYCVPILAFGACGSPFNLQVAPLQKINHDISTGEILPVLFLIGSIALGLLAGWFWKRNPLNQPPLRIFFKVIGYLLLGCALFVCSVIFFWPFANWIAYPSIPEFYIRLIVITALSVNFLLRLTQIQSSNTSISND